MDFVSLFSGIGGFDLAFERAGMRCVLQVEKDAHARGVLARHFPNTERMEDVRDVARLPDSTRLVCGGFPCQDLSVAGHRKGLAGERSGLWFEFLRLIEASTPEWVVIENVPGLLTSNRGRDFGIVLAGLGKCGYFSAWRILDSQYFGVAQRRRRVFIVAHLRDGRAAQVLFEREGVRGNPAAGEEAQQETPRLVGTLAASGAGTARPAGQANELDMLISVDRDGVYRARNVASTLRADSHQSNVDLIPQTFGINSELSVDEDLIGALSSDSHSGGGHQPMVFTNNQFAQFAEADVIFPLRARGSNGDENLVLDPRLFNNRQFGEFAESEVAATLGERGANEPENVLAFDWNASASASLNPSEVAPVMKAQRHGAAVHLRSGVRRLMPIECERLQGFPDGWTEGQSDTQRYRQLGNAVTVNVVQWIGERIMQAENDLVLS